MRDYNGLFNTMTEIGAARLEAREQMDYFNAAKNKVPDPRIFDCVIDNLRKAIWNSNVNAVRAAIEDAKRIRKGVST